MLGRQVTVALRRPLQARLQIPQTQHNLCIRTFSHAPQFLSPAGRPKKAVGEPSKPIKRSVKAAAKRSASADTDAAAKKVAEKKKLAEKKKKAADAKKAQKAKKVLTPEQIEKKKKALKSEELKDLKKLALAPPKPARSNTYLEFVKEKGKNFYPRDETVPAQVKLTELAKRLVAEYKDLTPAQVEHYNHLAHTTRDNLAAEYKRWVESHTPEEIRIANNARASLRRRETADKDQGRSVTKWANIKDERLVKRPMTAYILFSQSRQASEDFRNIALTDRSKLLAQEWKALDEHEKQKYFALQKEDHERYNSEYTSAYGSPPPGSERNSPVAAA